MEVKIENMVFGWHEELPEMFIELLNTLVLTKNEQERHPTPTNVWRTDY